MTNMHAHVCAYINTHGHMCWTLFSSLLPVRAPAPLKPASCAGNLPGGLGLSFLGRPMPATAYLRDPGRGRGQPTGLRLCTGPHPSPRGRCQSSFRLFCLFFTSLPCSSPSLFPCITLFLQSFSCFSFSGPSKPSSWVSSSTPVFLSLPSPFCFFSLLWLPLASLSLSLSFSSYDLF